MASTIQLSVVRRITVHCPVAAKTIAAVAGGNVLALQRDKTAGPIMAYLANCPDLRAFDNYHGVCEVSIGVEAFTPAVGAKPTEGRIGERTHHAMAAVTVYALDKLPQARLLRVLKTLSDLHPWETPVIEIAKVTLAKARLNRP